MDMNAITTSTDHTAPSAKPLPYDPPPPQDNRDHNVRRRDRLGGLTKALTRRLMEFRDTDILAVFVMLIPPKIAQPLH